MNRHTPTPWRANSRSQWYSIRDAQGRPVLYVEHSSGACNRGESYANARYVLKAVNHHDRLVSTIKELLDEPGHSDFAACDRARALLEELETRPAVCHQPALP